MKKKSLISLFLFLILVNTTLIIAPPNPQSSSNIIGLDVESPIPDIIKFNSSFDAHIHIYNSTDGLPVTGASCNLHIYNSTGQHIYRHFEAAPEPGDIDFEFNIPQSNTSILGQYKYVAWCNNTYEGGFYSDFYEVTVTGEEIIEGIGSMLFGFFILIFGIGWFFLVLSMKMQEPGPKIFFLLASFIFLMGSLLMAMVSGFESNVPPPITTTLRVMMLSLGLITFTVFAYIMIKQTVQALDLLRQKKGYETGF